VKHGPPGSPIRLAAEAAEGEVRVTVADQGPGIDPRHREALFQKFSRLPGNGEGGHGLGLYITRTIAEAHGGRVWVECRPGRGATFGLAIPWAAAAVPRRRRRARLSVPH
jgi:signal transduction histidine kinase